MEEALAELRSNGAMSKGSGWFMSLCGWPKKGDIPLPVVQWATSLRPGSCPYLEASIARAKEEVLPADKTVRCVWPVAISRVVRECMFSCIPNARLQAFHAHGDVWTLGGVSTRGGDWGETVGPVVFQPYSLCFDLSKMDTMYHARLHHKVCELRCAFADGEVRRFIVETYDGNEIGWIILPDGSVYLRIGLNDSGRYNTYNDNEIVLVAIMLAAVYLAGRDVTGRDLTFREVLEIAKGKGGGDNGTLSCSIRALALALVKWIPFVAWNGFGFKIKWEATPPSDPASCVVFSHYTRVIPWRGHTLYLPILLRESKLLATLFLRTSGANTDDVFMRLASIVAESYGGTLFDKLHLACMFLLEHCEHDLSAYAQACLLPKESYPLLFLGYSHERSSAPGLAPFPPFLKW